MNELDNYEKLNTKELDKDLNLTQEQSRGR